MALGLIPWGAHKMPRRTGSCTSRAAGAQHAHRGGIRSVTAILLAIALVLPYIGHTIAASQRIGSASTSHAYGQEPDTATLTYVAPANLNLNLLIGHPTLPKVEVNGYPVYRRIKSFTLTLPKSSPGLTGADDGGSKCKVGIRDYTCVYDWHESQSKAPGLPLLRFASPVPPLIGGILKVTLFNWGCPCSNEAVSALPVGKQLPDEIETLTVTGPSRLGPRPIVDKRDPRHAFKPELRWSYQVDYEKLLADCINMTYYHELIQRTVGKPILVAPAQLMYFVAEREERELCVYRIKTAYYSQLFAVDPPNSNYLAVALPLPIATVTGDPGCAALSADARPACLRQYGIVRNATIAAAQVASVEVAAYTALNRLSSAETAHSSAGVALQTAVLLTEAGALAKARNGASQADAALGAEFRRLRINTKMTTADVAAGKAMLLSGAFPAPVLTALQAQSITQADLRRVFAQAASKVSSVPPSFELAAALASPPATVQLTTVYRQLTGADVAALVAGLQHSGSLTQGQSVRLKSAADKIASAGTRSSRITAAQYFIAAARSIGGATGALLGLAATPLLM
jgi:hypothetical protein